MKSRFYLYTIAAWLINIPLNRAYADGKVAHAIEVAVHPAYVFPTHEFFRGDNASHRPIRMTWSGHLKYGFKFSPDTYWGALYPYAIQGIGVGYHSFMHSEEMGNPVSVYAFQASRIARISEKLSLDYEWNFGASFGWEKYNVLTNPWNRVVGSKVNAYINLGFLFNWNIFPHTYLKGGIAVTHFSNGNTNYPNSGVNILEASVGVVRTFDMENKKTQTGISRQKKQFPLFRRHITYDILVYGATKRKGVFPVQSSPVLAPGRFGVLGVNCAALYNFTPFFRSGASLDLQYDESANIGNYIANTEESLETSNIKFYRPPFRKQLSVGMSVRTEIVMPVFCISLGIGHNLYGKGPDNNSFYQIFALKTELTRYLFLHVGYQLYKFKNPNNLMLGLGIRLNNRTGE